MFRLFTLFLGFIMWFLFGVPTLSRKIPGNGDSPLASSGCFLHSARRSKAIELHGQDSVLSTAATTFGGYGPSDVPN